MATATVVLILAGAAVAGMPEKTISISTSGKGGSWFAVGSRVIREVEKQNPGLVTQVQTGGGLTNLRKIQAGQADIGMTFAFAAPMAYKAQAPFKKPHDKLTYLGTLFPGYLQIVTRKSSNINKFEDLFDKRISAGKIGWGGELMFRLLLKNYGMDYDKIRAKGGVINHVGTAQSTQMMRDGNMDAIVSGGSPPSHPKFSELSVTTGIDLLKIDNAGLDKIFKSYPSLVETTMPANPYKGVKGGFRVIGGAVILVAKKSLSDEAAYRIVKAFYENLDGIKADMKQLREAQAKDALKGNKGLPIHPGAARYYKEKGLM
ncbi:MAG: TAXI family TRAP transporter solute-binding subunit [Alphaproteobacteria bacterium]|nr:TAXI family TRAP transporter solute-binding subunit [Alphaproteobacteria bacterium]